MAETRELLRHNEGNAATGGIWRVTTDSRSRILKVAQHGEVAEGSAWHTSDEPTHINYWRREALAYETGCAVAKYNWLGAAAIGAAVRGRGRKASYNQDDSAEETVRRISGLAALLAEWADGLD